MSGNQITFTSKGTEAEGPNDEEMVKTFDGEETTTDNENDEGTQSQDEGQPGEETQGDDRPDWLPEKFKSPEDLAKAYAELEKKQGKDADKEEAEGEGDEDDADKDKAEGDDDKPSPKDLTEDDLADYSKELAETGEISDESREKLLEMFEVPEFLMDTYIEGAKAINERQTSTIQNAFGGEEQQNAILEWAGQNLSDEEMGTVNKQFESGDMNTVLFAIDALKGKYEGANGKAPSKRLGGEASKTSGDAYGSWDEVSRDMGDDKYHSDPAFRAQVEQKLAASKNL